MAAATQEDNAKATTAIGRARAASTTLFNATPPYGMWTATAAVVANAPNVDQLRQPIAGGQNLSFDGTRTSLRVQQEPEGGQILVRRARTEPILREEKEEAIVQTQDLKLAETMDEAPEPLKTRSMTLQEAIANDKEPWSVTVKNGLSMFGKFVITPWGFLITLYGLNIVAWGAMLFFLLLDAAPAMDHPNKDDLYSPRKIWLEIDSQILNALFCVTGFGLAPWRIRDLYHVFAARCAGSLHARAHLAEQNKSWFRPPISWESGTSSGAETQIGPHRALCTRPPTYTGLHAPPTSLWKLHFVVWMMVLNSLLQVVLAFFMWHYSRFNRPTWATGTFIALGCAVAMFAGLLTYWEGRKVKKIEGPLLVIDDDDEAAIS